MALYQGVQGKISFQKASSTETFVVHMTGWSVNLTKSIDETPYFGGSLTEEGYTEKTPGVKSWSASADGAADFAEGAGQKDLLDAYYNDEIVTFTAYLDAETALRGEAYVESLDISHAADGKAEISISLSGNGVAELVTLPES